MSIDLEAIRQRADAATPGPWTAHPDGLVWGPGPGDPVSGSEQAEDAEFIAAARQDIPALLAEIDRLTRERETDYKAGYADGATAMGWERVGDQFEHEAEIKRLMTVVDAAKAWRAQFEKPANSKPPRMAALIAAVDALEADAEEQL